MRRIGMIGGGQLGRMAIEEARKYLAHVEVLSPDYPSPASDLADVVHLGALDDYEGTLELGEDVDVVSYEIESVSVEALRELERRGKAVIPAAGVLGAIRDKLGQKRVLEAAGIPVARYATLDDAAGAGRAQSVSSGAAPRAAALEAAAASLGGFPLVQKARSGGYDGHGVAILASASDPGLLRCPSYAEERVDFEKELAVVVARSPGGEAAVYPCVEMVFDPAVNLCDSVLAPARIAPELRSRAEALARAAVEAICSASERSGSPASGSAGVFGVEMFLSKAGEILVNEIAPRPHNSGHFTIEACASSQFDQYMRILLGLPLGSPELLRPAMMLNLLGGDEPGESEYLGVEEALAVPGVALHLYGKRETRPFRKMGHLTALGESAEEAIERANAARSALRIRGRSS